MWIYRIQLTVLPQVSSTDEGVNPTALVQSIREEYQHLIDGWPNYNHPIELELKALALADEQINIRGCCGQGRGGLEWRQAIDESTTAPERDGDGDETEVVNSEKNEIGDGYCRGYGHGGHDNGRGGFGCGTIRAIDKPLTIFEVEKVLEKVAAIMAMVKNK